MTTTVADLLAAGDAELLGFLACWERDRRCPLPLVDWLLERDLPACAEGARWAATWRDREVPGGDRRPPEGRLSGPFPYAGTDGWTWYCFPNERDACCDLVPDLVKRKMPHSFSALFAAFAGLLDCWVAGSEAELLPEATVVKG